MRIIAPCALTLTLAVAGPAQAQQTSAVAEQQFYNCTSDMALWNLRRKDGQINKKLVDEVFSDCLLQMPDNVLVGSERDRNAWIAQAKRKVAAQIEKLAPRAKVEKADEDQVGANYFLCLERHAKVLALTTEEAADIVAQASLSACPTERAAVFEVHRRYNERWEEGTMKAMESVLVQHLLLEIVEVRAQRDIAPPPREPKSLRTPI